MRSRKLNLAKETLGALGSKEMGRVVGGAVSVAGVICFDLAETLQFDCINDITFEWCPMPRTLPLEECI